MKDPKERMDELLAEFERAFQRAWCKSTCYPPLRHLWNKKNPSLGQCAVTALVIQYIFGGKIIGCNHAHHYWNRLDNRREIDLTKPQFPKETLICEDCEKSREYLLESDSAKTARTKERFTLLLNRVMKFMRDQS